MSRIICPHCGLSLHHQLYFHTTYTGDSYVMPCLNCGKFMSVKVRDTKFWFETTKHDGGVIKQS